MYVKSVSITGFRSLYGVDVELQPYTCLIGRNDAGKSAFLRALQLLFDPKLSFTEDDVCKLLPSCDECSIEASIEDSPPDIPIAAAGVMRLKRTFKPTPKLEYKGEGPASAVFQRMMAGTLTRGDWTGSPEASAENIAIVNDHIRAGGRVPADEWKAAYGALKLAGKVPMELCWCPVAPDELSRYVQVFFLPADSRAEEEIGAGQNATFSKIGNVLLKQAISRNFALRDAYENLQREVERVGAKDEHGHWQLSEITEVERLISSELARFDPQVQITTNTEAPKLTPLNFTMRLDVKDEYVEGVSKMGHGLRRSLMFAMLQALKQLRANQKAAQNDEASTLPTLCIFLIEEPELYLHPQAERERFRELEEFAQQDDTLVVVATHSAFFVNVQSCEGILRFERPEREKTIVKGWVGPKPDTNLRDALKVAYRLEPTSAAMLFARLVILAEGQTERVCVPYLAEKLGLGHHDVEVVDCRGAEEICAFQQLLEGLSVKYVTWFDADRPKDIASAQRIRTMKNGRIVVADPDWEGVAAITLTGQKTKVYDSYKKYVVEGAGPTIQLAACIRAAYAWEDYGLPVTSALQVAD